MFIVFCILLHLWRCVAGSGEAKLGKPGGDGDHGQYRIYGRQSLEDIVEWASSEVGEMGQKAW